MSEHDEEVELKDLVFSKLENTAFLRNIRAQLRAQIYHLIETNETKDDQNSALNQMLKTENGRLALGLVDDLLEKLELRYTGTVFKSESSYNNFSKSTAEIRSCLDLELDDENKTPILMQLLEKVNPNGNKPVSVDSNKSNSSEPDDSTNMSRNSL